MGTSRLFMPLLTELGGLGDGFCYKYVAPNGAPELERRLFNKAKPSHRWEGRVAVDFSYPPRRCGTTEEQRNPSQKAMPPEGQDRFAASGPESFRRLRRCSLLIPPRRD